MKTFKQHINESSLSRVFNQTKKYDSGTITAFRSAKDCNDGEEFSKGENKKRNSILKAKLLKLGYGVTAVDGTYIENFKTKDEREVKEDSFLVLDLKGKGNLKKDLISLGLTKASLILISILYPAIFCIITITSKSLIGSFEERFKMVDFTSEINSL